MSSYANLPHDDQGRIILISTWLLTALSLLFLSLRLYCKFGAHRGLWYDDYVLIASWIFLAAGEALVTVDVGYGTGKHVWDVSPENFAFLGLTGNLVGTFTILAAVLSKTSFALTLLRLLEGRWRLFVWFIIITINVAMGLNALFLWVRCNPVEKTWNVDMPGTCWAPNLEPDLGMFFAGYSAVTDFVLAFLPWKIVWKLQMRKTEKFGVALAMSMGVFAGATSVMKTVEIPSLASGDFTYYAAGLTIWSAAESAVSIMACSIPFLRTLFRDLGRGVSSRKYFVSNSETTATKGSKSVRSHIIRTNEVDIEFEDRNVLVARADAGRMV